MKEASIPFLQLNDKYVLTVPKRAPVSGLWRCSLTVALQA
jgi:hypothetical protein